MKNIESEEELDILKKVENDEYESLDTNDLTAMKKTLKKAASNTIERLSKRKAINIRLLESDIERIKAMALNEGMSYQTYISHMIHKLTTGRLRHNYFRRPHIVLYDNLILYGYPV